MKKVIITLLCLSFISTSFAQSKIHIHHNTATDVRLFTSLIDSLTFQKENATSDQYTTFTINRTNGSKQVISIASVDSIELGKDSSNYLFDITALPEIRFDVKLKDWNTLLTNFDKYDQNEEMIPAHFAFTKNGKTVELDSVGIRIRGNSSVKRPEGSKGDLHSTTNADWHHAHFAVQFSEYKDGQSIYNTDRIILKWFKDDPAYCREVYCYDLFKKFGVWSAPRASYTRLTINIEGDARPAYFGVYALIESPNSDYLKYRVLQGNFPNDNGNLWKASYGADLRDISNDQMGIENVTLSESTSQFYVYDLKTNKKTGLAAAKTQLTSFVSGMKSLTDGSTDLKTYLEAHMDVDLFLRAIAVNVMVGMWDDYWVNKNNFFFYFDTNGKFYFIPYDYDNTLGTSAILHNSGTQDLLNWGYRSDERLLIKKVLSIAVFENQYKAYLKELANSGNDYFDADKSLARINKWQALIANYVSNDTGDDMTIQDKPASWSNCDFYRLKSGNDAGGSDGNANFFKTKIKCITW